MHCILTSKCFKLWSTKTKQLMVACSYFSNTICKKYTYRLHIRGCEGRRTGSSDTLQCAVCTVQLWAWFESWRECPPNTPHPPELKDSCMTSQNSLSFALFQFHSFQVLFTQRKYNSSYCICSVIDGALRVTARKPQRSYVTLEPL